MKNKTTSQVEQGYEVFDLSKSAYEDIYNHKWNYEEAKVLLVLGEYADTETAYGLDVEELMFIAKTIFKEWREGYCDAPVSARETWITSTYPWIKVRNRKEEGYVQAYARRVARDFIELYKEENEKL